MVSLHYKFEFLLFLLLFGNIKIANSTCQTQKVFPFVFGAGTWDMQIYDLALDSSFNIGIVGTSKQSKATGEGFYIFMDSYGKVIYQKQYISTYNLGDEIRFLQYYSDMPYLMGLCKDSSTNIPFLLVLNTDGSIYYHFKGGQFGSTFPTNAALSSFQVISNIYAIYGYQGDQSGTPLIGMEAIYISTSGTGTAFPFSGTTGAICYPKYLSNGNIFALGIFSSRIIAVNLDNSNPITSIICCSVLKYFFNTVRSIF